MDKYKNVGTHAQDLVGGRMVGVGEDAEVDLSADDLKDPHTKALIEDGTLVKQERPKKGEEA